MRTYLVATGVGMDPAETGWTESLDNLWCDSEGCMTEVLAGLGHDNDNGQGFAYTDYGSDRPVSARYGMATYGAYPGGSETDYDVHCAACGDLMWHGLSED